MENETKHYITKEGLIKLKANLDDLINIERQKIADRIQEAKELGDLSENAEYSAAKEEQAFLEMKIAELDNVIKNAVIIEDNAVCDGVVNVGCRVSFKDDTGNQREYIIVGSHEADPSQGKISNESPIGRAFLGKKVGDLAEFKAPKEYLSLKF